MCVVGLKLHSLYSLSYLDSYLSYSTNILKTLPQVELKHNSRPSQTCTQADYNLILYASAQAALLEIFVIVILILPNILMNCFEF